MSEPQAPIELDLSAEARSAHARDWSPSALVAARSGEAADGPDAVATPVSTEEVSALLAWAQETGTPVVPFGLGSGVVEGIAPSGGVVCSLSALNQISEVDEKSRLVTAGAGVSGPALREHLARAGHLLGHEPQSVDISTVGGWIATRACGQLSARYGGIEALVAGLEAVLPDGRIVRSKVTPRRSAGPDLAHLMMGSEGALGIVTEATLRVSPLPKERADLCLRFEHMADGVAVCRRLAQSDLRPTMVRLYDAEDAAIFLRSHPDEEQSPFLIASFDGPEAERRRDEAGALGGVPGNEGLVAHWWEHRNDGGGEYRKMMAGQGMLGPHGLIETIEISGTWSVLRDLYHRVKEALMEEAMLAGCHLSHIYPDGAGLYFTVVSMCGSDAEAIECDRKWWEAAMSACAEAGGSISHHHGIGRIRAPWLEQELGGWFPALQAIKRTLDPKGIMNPGVLGL